MRGRALSRLGGDGDIAGFIPAGPRSIEVSLAQATLLCGAAAREHVSHEREMTQRARVSRKCLRIEDTKCRVAATAARTVAVLHLETSAGR